LMKLRSQECPDHLSSAFRGSDVGKLQLEVASGRPLVSVAGSSCGKSVHFQPANHHAAPMLGIVDTKLPVAGTPWYRAPHCHRIREKVARPRMKLMPKHERERAPKLAFDELELGCTLRIPHTVFLLQNHCKRSCGLAAAGRRGDSGRDKGAEAERPFAVEGSL